jgi:hypothetical protein
MNDTEKLLANIAKIDYPEARFLTYKNGTFWANGDGEPEGLFASETHDKVFSAALWLDDDWTLWLKEPSDDTKNKLAALADAALPEWTLVEVWAMGEIVAVKEVQNEGAKTYLLGRVSDYPHLKAGDRFTRWSRQLWREEAQ